MSEPVIACYVAQSGDSYEIFTSGHLSALEYIPPEEDSFPLDEELVPLEDQVNGAFVAVKTSGDFRDRPYFPVYATEYSVRETRQMVREKLRSSETRLDINQAHTTLFEALAKKGNCLVGKLFFPEKEKTP